MFAYSVQNYTPAVLGWTPQTLEPAAILCLAVSFFCGLKRLEAHYHHLGISYEKNQALGDAQEIQKALKQAEPHLGALPPLQQEYMDGWRKKMEAQHSRAKSADPILDKLDRQMGFLYHSRNRLMMAGFLLLVCSKIGTPYFSPTDKPKVTVPTKDQGTSKPQKEPNHPQPTANKSDAGNGS